MSCQELGLTLEEFIGLAIDAMQSIAGDLGL
jgi:predicted hydrolase (HD superfamily)